MRGWQRLLVASILWAGLAGCGSAQRLQGANPCLNRNGGCSVDATCSSNKNVVSCRCFDGYSGDGKSCTPIDNCATNNGGCDTHATCTTTGPAQNTCACDTGYSGDGKTCTPINNCAKNNGGCDVHATCTMTGPGVNACMCNPGYTGDGTTCTPVNPCDSNNGGCDIHALCTPTGPDANTCACLSGYMGDGMTCTAIDNCAKSNGGCDQNAMCKVTGPGMSTCTCKTGFMGSGFTCTPIDACATNNGGCDPHAICASTGPGTDVCTCETGYMADGTACTPINNCATKNGGCDVNAYCLQTGPGTNTCTCKGTYMGNGYVCTAIDSCTVNHGGCSVNAKCTPTAPDANTCACNSGYMGDGKTCTAIDNCATNNGGCGMNAICIDTGPGTNTCQCAPGYSIDGIACTPINNCLTNNGGCDPHATCAYTGPGTNTCTCDLGYSGTGTVCTRDYTFNVLSTGGGTTCGVLVDGTLWCWGLAPSIWQGESALGSPTLSQVGTDSDWATLAVQDTGRDVCAIKTGGTLWCWGSDNTSGELGTGDTSTSAVPVQVGTDAGWEIVALADTHACALKTDGSRWCWGNNADGELGDGTATSQRAPELIDTGWSSLVASGLHSCGLKSDQSLWCWGKEVAGELGDNQGTGIRISPEEISPGTAWSAITASANSTCGLHQSDGSLWCWGDYVATDSVPGLSSNVPARVSGGPWVSVSGGGLVTCAIDPTERIWCWGTNNWAQNGNGTTLTWTTPTSPIPDGATWKAVSATGGTYACGLDSTGKAYCWGANDDGQLGHPTYNPVDLVPRQISGAPGWNHIATPGSGGATPGSGGATCGIHHDGTLWCWGVDAKIGTGPSVATEVYPTQLGSVNTWTSISAGGAGFWCAMRADKSLWCWGDNTYGELGDGTTTDRFQPVRIGSNNMSWQMVSAGATHTCAIDAAGYLWCWGDNSDGEAAGAMSLESTPQQVASGKWTDVAAGQSFTCGLPLNSSSNGSTVECWGNGAGGVLGNGSSTSSASPAPVSGSLLAFAITAGRDFACAIDSTQVHALFCWGSGPVGGGSSVPAQVATPTTSWLSVAASPLSESACAMDSNHHPWCWGDNAYGQVGDGTTITRSAPVQISPNAWSELTIGGHSACGIQNNALWCWGTQLTNDFGDGSGLSWAPVSAIPP